MKWNSSLYVCCVVEDREGRIRIHLMSSRKQGRERVRHPKAETINKTNATPLFHSLSSCISHCDRDDASSLSRYKCYFAPSLDLFVIFHCRLLAARLKPHHLPVTRSMCFEIINMRTQNGKKGSTMKIKLMACCENQNRDYDVA